MSAFKEWKSGQPLVLWSSIDGQVRLEQMILAERRAAWNAAIEICDGAAATYADQDARHAPALRFLGERIRALREEKE